MMKTGGCSAEPRLHASRLAGPHPCLPPKGEGEKARGEESHLSHPHPCPLPQAGEGVHTKFIAASACYMGARGILHDGNWRLSCSATAAWIKPGRPPSLPSPRGGRRGSQRGKGSPLPPLFPPPVGEGAKAGGRTNHWRSINRSLVQPFFQHQIHNPLLSLIRSHAMVFLEKVCYPDHCLGPFLVALAPGVGGDALPCIPIK